MDDQRILSPMAKEGRMSKKMGWLFLMIFLL